MQKTILRFPIIVLSILSMHSTLIAQENKTISQVVNTLKERIILQKQNNYIAGLQYWFYPKCRLQTQYTFCDKKGNGLKNSNLKQIQVRF